MEKAPLSMRKHIAILGNTNAGKSSLFNGLLGQALAIVSDVKGTTTDPVTKAMELIGYGPVAIIDTAGLGDKSILGEKRMEKTKNILNRCDLAIIAEDILSSESFEIDLGRIPCIKVFTKCDLADTKLLEEKKRQNPDRIFLSGYTDEALFELKQKMIEMLKKQSADTETLLGNILNSGDKVVFVIPIDSAAPAGRLILPQVQAIRDCLDNGIISTCVTPENLKAALEAAPDTKLVVTDSQAFKEVSELVPQNIQLTSFSMLLANQKGRITQLIDGTSAIKGLKDGDKILMLEACTHITTHEDIGKVKIPALLQKVTGKKLEFTHKAGYDFPADIEEYALVIQCGGCMINKREILSRLDILAEKGIPVTNYGVVLAYLNGILERASVVFENLK